MDSESLLALLCLCAGVWLLKTIRGPSVQLRGLKIVTVSVVAQLSEITWAVLPSWC